MSVKIMQADVAHESLFVERYPVLQSYRSLWDPFASENSAMVTT